MPLLLLEKVAISYANKLLSRIAWNRDRIFSHGREKFSDRCRYGWAHDPHLS